MNRERQHIRQLLRNELNHNTDNCTFRNVEGGDIHSSLAVSSTGTQNFSYFVKFNTREKAEVLQSEYRSLRELGHLFPSVYPRPALFHVVEDRAYLIMQFFDLTSLSNQTSSMAGEQLAAQHQIINEKFGWSEDNYIGSNHQLNDWRENWPEFFRDCRLAPQLSLAREKNLQPEQIDKIERICLHIDEWFTDYQPEPSLLHGDLWSGNIAYNVGESKPALYDPAPYFGDRETDIAMTQLFGQFPAPFYESYNQVWPLDPGYGTRKPLYNLYHALNHFVLFGQSYQGMVQLHTQELTQN